MNGSLLWRTWRIVRWPLGVLAVAIVVFVGWRVVVLNNKEATAADVARIHADRLEWSDINGDLPAMPDEAANNATLAGVDANQNGIRDDVEVAIYTKYKATPKVAIAMLQYAKALQKEFTSVYNSETLVAVIQEQSRGSICVSEDNLIEDVQKFTFNNETREKFSEELYEKYMTSYVLPNENYCDIIF